MRSSSSAGLTSPTSRRPSEYWQSNATTCLSFAHRAEVEMRYEIGIDTIAFGATTRIPKEPGPTPGSGSATPSPEYPSPSSER